MSGREQIGDAVPPGMSGPVVIWETALPEFAFSHISPNAEAVFGYPLARWSEPGFFVSLLHPDERAEIIDFCLRETGSGQDHEMVYRLRRADGRYIWVRDVVSVIDSRRESRVLRGAFLVRGEGLDGPTLQAPGQLRDAARLRVVHECLAALAPTLERAGQRRPDGVSSDAIGAIADAMRTVLSLAGPVSSTQIHAGSEAISVRQIGMCLSAAEASGARIEVGPELAAGVRAPRAVLDLILTLVAETAAGFGARGRIAVRTAGGDLSLRLAVSDPSREVVAVLRHLTTEGAESAMPDAAGLGLAKLALAACAAEKLGGAARLDREMSGSVEFSLFLPLAPNPAEAAALPPIRVLYAEDDPTNAHVMEELLQLRGIDTEVVRNGRAAIEAYQNFGYDLVLMDVRMPIMGGFEATREIRAVEIRDGRPRIPIIGVTAHVRADDVEDCFRAGMDAHLAKPVRLDDLTRLLSRFLPRLRGADKTGEAP
ncbi:MAG: response regulator [Paracoccaceae bacterium]